jgi:hypothetical protein
MTPTMTQADSIDRRRRYVPNDVEPIHQDAVGWMPAPVAEASEAVRVALERRDDLEIEAEQADDDLRAARRADSDAAIAAVRAGDPLPPAGAEPAEETAREAWRALHAADQVAHDAINAYTNALREQAGAIDAAVGARMSDVQAQARKTADRLEGQVGELARLARLRMGLDPNLGVQGTRAWEVPAVSAHRGLQAIETVRTFL